MIGSPAGDPRSRQALVNGVLSFIPLQHTTPVLTAPTRSADPLAEQVQLAQRGDRAAMRALLRALGPRLLRVVRGVLGSGHPELEDVLQEAMLAVVRALDAFRGEGEVEGYAVRITLRAAIAARRRHRARTAPVSPLEEAEPDLPTTSEAPQSDEALAGRRRSILRSLLDELPEAQAEALVLRTILGMSLAETAEVSRVPENTVRSRMRLAREALRRRIESDPVLLESLELEP